MAGIWGVDDGIGDKIENFNLNESQDDAAGSGARQFAAAQEQFEYRAGPRGYQADPRGYQGPAAPGYPSTSAAPSSSSVPMQYRGPRAPAQPSMYAGPLAPASDRPMLFPDEPGAMYNTGLHSSYSAGGSRGPRLRNANMSSSAGHVTDRYEQYSSIGLPPLLESRPYPQDGHGPGRVFSPYGDGSSEYGGGSNRGPSSRDWNSRPSNDGRGYNPSAGEPPRPGPEPQPWPTRVGKSGEFNLQTQTSVATYRDASGREVIARQELWPDGVLRTAFVAPSPGRPSSSPGGGNQLIPHGAASPAATPGGPRQRYPTPEHIRQMQQQFYSGDPGGSSLGGAFGMRMPTPPEGRPIAARDHNVAQITEGMGGMRSPSGSGGASPHSGANARGERGADPFGVSPYGSADERGKRKAVGTPSDGGSPPPRQQQHLGPPGASGPSHHDAGQSVARTSRPVPVAAAPFGYTIPAPMFPAVDSQDVAWAQSNEVHPLFLPRNRGLRPNYNYDLPQDALDNLRFNLEGSEGLENDLANRFGFANSSVIINLRRDKRAKLSRTGPTMRPLDPRPADFGRRVGKFYKLSEQGAIFLHRQFNKGHSNRAIAEWFGITPDAVQKHKQAWVKDN